MSKTNLIPIGGGSDTHAYAEFTDIGIDGDGWYDLITWPSVTGLDTSGADFIIFLSANNTNAVVTYRINVNTIRGIDDPEPNTTMRLLGRVEYGSVGSGTDFRIIRDDETDPNSAIRLQMEFDSGNNFNGLMSSILPLDYPTGTVFGAGQLYTPTGNELSIKSISTDNWSTHSIVDGATGGVACDSIGSHGQDNAFISFNPTLSEVDTIVNDVSVIRASEFGTRLNSAEYKTWVKDSSFVFNGSPVDFTGKEVQQALNEDNFTYPTVTTTLDSQYNWSLTGYSFATGYSYAILPTGLGNWLNFNITGTVPRQTLKLRAKVAVVGNAPTSPLEVHRDGVLINSITLPANSEDGIWYDVATLPYGDLDIDDHINGINIRLSRPASSSGGTPNDSYILDFGMSIESIEPDLEDGVVFQLDSNSRGALMPRILKFTDDAPDGAMAIDTFSSRPMFKFGTEANNRSFIATSRFGVAAASHTINYSVDTLDGDPELNGWVYQGDNATEQAASESRINVIDNQYGYDKLLQIVDDTTSYPIGMYAVPTDQAMQDMGANGWRWEFDVRVDSGVDDALVCYVDLDSNYPPASSGARWLVQFHDNGTNVIISSLTNTIPANGIVADSGELIHVSMQVEPNETLCNVYVNGVHVGSETCDLTSSRSPGIFHTSGSSGKNNMTAWLLNSNFMVMSASDTTITLSKEDLDYAIRHNTPNVINSTNVLLPKGTYDIGTSFTLINGSEHDMDVRGVDGSNMIFNGNNFCTVPPYGKGEFVMTSFPRGVIWAVSGAKEGDPDLADNYVKINVQLTSAGATLLNRIGTYKGGITLNRLATGQCQIVPDDAAGHSFTTDNSYAIACSIDTSGSEVTVNYSGGYLDVHTWNSSGAAADVNFAVELHW